MDCRAFKALKEKLVQSEQMVQRGCKDLKEQRGIKDRPVLSAYPVLEVFRELLVTKEKEDKAEKEVWRGHQEELVKEVHKDCWDHPALLASQLKEGSKVLQDLKEKWELQDRPVKEDRVDHRDFKVFLECLDQREILVKKENGV